MAAIGASASAASAFAPRLLMRVLGVDPRQLTPTAALGLRLFAIRTVLISALAARGDVAAREAFLPVQLLDQLSWWELYRRRALGLRPTLGLSTISGAIILLDLRRRARGG